MRLLNNNEVTDNMVRSSVKGNEETDTGYSSQIKHGTIYFN